MLQLLQSYGSDFWELKLADFMQKQGSLISKYESKRHLTKIPVQVNGQKLHFSEGKHNQLQKEILEEFAPRFAQGTECLYVGDTEEKSLLKEDARLCELGFEITQHDTMPDIVLYSREKKLDLFY